MTDAAASHAALPPSVTRPLFHAAWAIAAFIAFFAAWASLAPLATTLHLSGKIISSRPTFELQHPYGGLIGDVLVRRHDRVLQGQRLLRMDMALEQTQLATLVQTKTLIETENNIIDALLESEATKAQQMAPYSPFVERHRLSQIQIQQQRQTAAFLEDQAEALRQKLQLSQQQLAMMHGRQERQSDLANKGLISRSEGEILAEQVLLIKSEIQEDRAALASLLGQVDTAQRQSDLIKVALRESLSMTQGENEKRLQDVDRQIAGLRDRIAQADIKSPVDGVVSDIPFQATGMFAARGATLVSLAQPLDQPMVSFQVPAAQIDQMHSGMTGRLILTSLPQRSMPNIDIEVLAISPRATEDEHGNPVSYTGRATLDQNSLELLSTADLQITLTEDMPARLLIDARKTTLSAYLLAPLLAAFQNAFQD